MIRHSLIFILSVLSLNGYCQIETKFYGYNYLAGIDGFSDSLGTGTYFTSKDSSRIMYIANDKSICKLFDKNRRLLVEGDLGGRCFVDHFKRYGKWSEYYQNGNLKSTGYYYEDNPIGLWQYFFENGNLKEIYNITLIQNDKSYGFCKTGLYQLYFETGQLKISGFYKAIFDSIEIFQYNGFTGEKNLKPKKFFSPQSKEYGIWTYYKQNGEIEKKHEFKIDE